MPLSSLDSQAINNFKEYLRIPSVQPDIDYSSCVEFLQKQGSAIGLDVVVLGTTVGQPVVILSWKGRQPQLPSLLLSSHMDVVPVYADKWVHPPFGAIEDNDGNIYARGAQDMKCVGIQYLEAVNRLKLRGYQPNRSVHICFTSDEEIGSFGMRYLVDTEFFKSLNVGCELDEGIASSDDTFTLFYGERTACAITIICSGTPGHGSLLHDNTAGEKLISVIQEFFNKRSEEKAKLEENSNLSLGEVTSINLTKIEGGVQVNVVPPELKVTFDCRLSINTEVDDFKKWVANVCQRAGEGVEYKVLVNNKRIPPTMLTSCNIWWVELKSQFDKMGLKVNTTIFPAATDARHIRKLGIPALGFSPINNTPVLLHDHNEFLNSKIFLKGIEIYCNIITGLAELS